MEENEQEARPIPSNLAEYGINESQKQKDNKENDDLLSSFSNSLKSISSCSSTSSKVSVNRDFLKMMKNPLISGDIQHECKKENDNPIESNATLVIENNNLTATPNAASKDRK